MKVVARKLRNTMVCISVLLVCIGHSIAYSQFLPVVSSYVYNSSALNSWWASLSRAAVGCGGVDIVWVGDSTTAGAYLNEFYKTPPSMVCRQLLQASLNPCGVPGGLGFISITNANGAVNAGISAYGGSAYGGGGELLGNSGWRYSAYSAPLMTLTITTSSSGDVFLPPATDIEGIIQSHPLGAYSGCSISMEPAGQTLTLVDSSISACASGVDYSSVRMARRASGVNSWSLSSAPSGGYQYTLSVTDSTKYFDIAGLFHYNGDFNCGVRMITLRVNGSLPSFYVPDSVTILDSSSGQQTLYGTWASNSMSIDNWAIGFDDTARSVYSTDIPSNHHVGVYVIDYGGINNYNIARNGDGTGKPGAYQGSLDYICSHIISLHPDASILLVPSYQIARSGVPPYVDIFDDTWPYHWAQYNTVCYAIADKYPANVAICDLWRATGCSVSNSAVVPSTNYMVQNGYLTPDKIHPDASGAAWIGNVVAGALLPPLSAIVKGNVSLSFYKGDLTSVPVTIKICDVSGDLVETHTVALDSAGNYSFSLNSAGSVGSYIATAKASHWLAKAMPLSGNVGGESTVNFTLINGDVNGDNFVEDQDYSLLGEAWYSAVGDSNYNVNADLNGDGFVEDQDYSIMGLAWYASGDPW